MGVILASCGGGGGQGSVGPDAIAVAQTSAANWLSADQRRRADQLISAFENSTIAIRYDYAENLHDGRGVTAGRAGFTTATCDALQVVRLYSSRVRDNRLFKFVPELERLCREHSDDTTGLPEADFMSAWRASASDEAFRHSQDEILDQEYYRPAMHEADRLGLRSAVARAELYDTAVQHGVGDYPDGLPAIISRASRRIGTPSKAGEERWLDTFFDVRIATLEHPANGDTRQEWAQSIDRVKCMSRIAHSGNRDLHRPIRFTVFGDEYQTD